MDSSPSHEDTYPLLRPSAPSTPHVGDQFTAQETQYSVIPEISPARSAFFPSSRDQFLYSPYLDSPSTAFTSPSLARSDQSKANSDSASPRLVSKGHGQNDQDGQAASKGLKGASLKSRQSPSDYHRKLTRETLSHQFYDGWLTEFLFAGLSVTLVLVIAVVLRYRDNKEQPQWPLGITINALVSLLSTAARAAMMAPVASCMGQLKWTRFARDQRPLAEFESLDNASRGVGGSALFLFQFKRQYLASLGALIMIFTLPISSLTQQAITTSQRLEPTNREASLSRAQNYTYDMQVSNDTYGKPYLDSSAIGAFYTGLFTPYDQSIEYLTPTCTSGNCTWRSYRSLGVCTRSEDISEQLKGYTLPNGAFLDAGSAVNITPISLQPSENPNVAPTNFTTVSFSDVRSPIADLFLIYSNTAGIARAFETVLYFCVMEYYTSVKDGVSNTVSNGTWTDLSVSHTGDITLMPPDEKVAYIVSGTAMWDLRNFAYETMSGSVYYDETSTYSSNFAQVLGPLGGLLPRAGSEIGNLRRSYQPLPLPRTIQGQPAINAVMQNIATSLSNNMQVNPWPNTTAVLHGQASTLQTFVQVRWVWLTPIGVFVALGYLLLVATVINNSRTKAQVWKTSSLPLLHVLGDEPRLELGALNSLSELQERAKKVTVVLEQQEDGWKFVGERQNPKALW